MSASSVIVNGSYKSAGDGDDGGGEKKEKKKKDKSRTKVMPTAEPMMVVNVNDRLGTKAAIPCLGSDPIRELLIP